MSNNSAFNGASPVGGAFESPCSDIQPPREAISMRARGLRSVLGKSPSAPMSTYAKMPCAGAGPLQPSSPLDNPPALDIPTPGPVPRTGLLRLPHVPLDEPVPVPLMPRQPTQPHGVPMMPRQPLHPTQPTATPMLTHAMPSQPAPAPLTPRTRLSSNIPITLPTKPLTGLGRRPIPLTHAGLVVGAGGIVRPAGQKSASSGDSGWNQMGQDAARQGLDVLGSTINRLEDRYLGGSSDNPYGQHGSGGSGSGEHYQSGQYGYQSSGAQQSSVPTWVWVAGGAVLLAGVGTAVVLATRKK